MQFGVLKGYNYGDIIDNLPDSSKIIFNDQRDLLKSIQNREIPLGISDLGVGMYYKKRELLNRILPVKQLNFKRPLHLAFNKKNTDAVINFNEGLKKITENGERGKILKAYYLGY